MQYMNICIVCMYISHKNVHLYIQYIIYVCMHVCVCVYIYIYIYYNTAIFYIILYVGEPLGSLPVELSRFEQVYFVQVLVCVPTYINIQSFVLINQPTHPIHTFLPCNHMGNLQKICFVTS